MNLTYHELFDDYDAIVVTGTFEAAKKVEKSPLVKYATMVCNVFIFLCS